MPQGRKRLAFTAEQKLHIIREIEGGRTKSDVSRALGLASSTVATIWKNREGVLSAVENQKNCLADTTITTVPQETHLAEDVVRHEVLRGRGR